MLRSPRARLLRTLRVSEIASRKLLTTIVDEATALTCLRSLTLHTKLHTKGATAARAIDLAPLWKQLAQLDHLVLDVSGATGDLVLPSLVELSLTTRGQGIAVLRDARLPALRALSIFLTDGPTLPSAWIAPERFPALQRLSLWCRDVIDPAPWSRAAISDQLELLDLNRPSRRGQTDREFVIDRAARPALAAGLLVTLRGDNTRAAGTLIVLPPTGELTIGRGDLGVEILRTTNHHFQYARFVFDAGCWAVREGSHVSVNGQAITQSSLRSGDEISVGRTELRFLEGDIEAKADVLRKRFALSYRSTSTVEG